MCEYSWLIYALKARFRRLWLARKRSCHLKVGRSISNFGYFSPEGGHMWNTEESTVSYLIFVVKYIVHGVRKHSHGNSFHASQTHSVPCSTCVIYHKLAVKQLPGFLKAYFPTWLMHRSLPRERHMFDLTLTPLRVVLGLLWSHKAV